MRADLLVQTRSGPVVGHREAGLSAWRGIPYAAAPVGDLRLRAPRSPEPWSEPFEAAQQGPVPPQPRTSAATGASRSTPMSEDCLSITVLRRTAAPAALPVMVFIYGGAFGIGSSGSGSYRGERLAARGDVVFVGFNYRLGALGWIDFSAYGTDARPIETNVGLRDQIAALRWVRDNIAAFGGDPDDVTLFGESAGGTSVAALMTAPAAAGLFSRAIIQSGAAGTIARKPRAAEWAADILGALAEHDDRPPVEILATATPEELMAATAKVEGRLADDFPGERMLGPVAGDDVIPEYPLDVLADGRGAAVPLIIGTNANEGTFFQLIPTIAATRIRVDRMMALAGEEAGARVLSAYPHYPSARSRAAMLTDVVFWHSSVAIAEGHSRVAPTWMYRFDFTTPWLRATRLGATHGVELDFVFGREDSPVRRVITTGGGARAARAVTARMMQRWLRFAHGGGADWPTYEPVDRKTLIVDVTDRVDANPQGDLLETWKGWWPYR